MSQFVHTKFVEQVIACLLYTSALQPDEGEIGIVHGDCAEDAAQLAAQLRTEHPHATIRVLPIEPTTGAHAGPGSLAVIFWGSER